MKLTTSKLHKPPIILCNCHSSPSSAVWSVTVPLRSGATMFWLRYDPERNERLPRHQGRRVWNHFIKKPATKEKLFFFFLQHWVNQIDVLDPRGAPGRPRRWIWLLVFLSLSRCIRQSNKAVVMCLNPSHHPSSSSSESQPTIQHGALQRNSRAQLEKFHIVKFKIYKARSALLLLREP